MATVSRYNAKDWTITVDNVYITQLGEDMFSFEKEEDYFEPVVGAQGDIVRSEINNDLHTFTLYVQPTSPQVPFLFNLYKRKDNFPVWAVNKELGLRVGGSQAWIRSAPESAFGASAEDLEFGFCVFDGVQEGIE